LWLPKFSQPRKYSRCDGVYRDAPIPVKFNVPFINYERDIFAMYDEWGRAGVLCTDGVSDRIGVMDAFFGLE
jgi:hypothetical protein